MTYKEAMDLVPEETQGEQQQQACDENPLPSVGEPDGDFFFARRFDIACMEVKSDYAEDYCGERENVDMEDFLVQFAASGKKHLYRHEKDYQQA